MKKFALIAIALLAASSATAGLLDALAGREAVPTSLHYFEYNRFAEGYLGSVPAVLVQKKYGMNPALIIQSDSLDPNKGGIETVLAQPYVDDYLTGIAKYQEWAAKAAEAGDIFEKDIGKYKVVSGQSVKFGFYGFSKGKYYLTLTPCMLFTCEKSSSLWFDEKGAAELARLLGGLKSGGIIDANKRTADKYN